MRIRLMRWKESERERPVSLAQDSEDSGESLQVLEVFRDQDMRGGKNQPRECQSSSDALNARRPLLYRQRGLKNSR